MNKYLQILIASGIVLLGSWSFAFATSTLIVPQGGTGVNTFTSSQLIYGNGTSALSSVATTTLSGSGVISVTAGAFIIGSSPVTVSCSTCGTGTLTAVTGTYPIISSGGTAPVISIAFGTTTTNTWSNLQTFTLGLNFNATSTGTFGINLTGGCYALGGACLTAGAIGGGSTQAVNWATVAVLAGTPTYSNGSSGVGATLTEIGTGALSVDSNSPAAGDRVLVKNQASAFQNGIYTVTATGSGIASYIITRATDYNSPSEITPGINTYVLSGTANTNTTWSVSYTPPLVIGTNNLTYTESAAGGTVTSIATNNGLTGGTITTSGTIGLAALGSAGVLGAVTATVPTVQATSTLFGGTATFGVGKVGIASTTPAFTLSVNNSGSDFYVTSTGKTVNRDPSTGYPGVNSPLHRLTLSTATTTAWYATTTGAYIPYVVAPFAGTIQNAQCSTATSTQGFLGIDTYIGSTHLAYFVASSTVGTITFSANNTFTAGQLINMSVGTTTNSQSSSASCTYGITETP